MTQAQLGFSGVAGDKIYFYTTSQNRLLDAKEVDTVDRGLDAAHGSQWLYPNAATPGAGPSCRDIQMQVDSRVQRGSTITREENAP